MYHYSVPPAGYTRYDYTTSASTSPSSSPPTYPTYTYYIPPQYKSPTTLKGHSRKASYNPPLGPGGWHSPPGSPSPAHYHTQPDYESPPAYQDYVKNIGRKEKPRRYSDRESRHYSARESRRYSDRESRRYVDIESSRPETGHRSMNYSHKCISEPAARRSPSPRLDANLPWPRPQSGVRRQLYDPGVEAREGRPSPGPKKETDIHESRFYTILPMESEVPVRSESRSVARARGRVQDEDWSIEGPGDNPQDGKCMGPGDQPGAYPEILLQPETRVPSYDQLVKEVKGIYAGLVMVEAKCIGIDEKQTAAATEKDLPTRTQLKNDQWQSLIALHKQLLHEHYDFFLASQHPAASPALSRLAAKYSVPAEMWRHGIHAFLEVLRHSLPDSLKHRLAFTYIPYSMMPLHYETVPTFEDTRIDFLGDLGGYRMAVEDDEPMDHEAWSNVARFWYNKAADKSLSVGRLYHHLAILARPYSLEQFSLYARSLSCVTPLESARGSIMTLFSTIPSGTYTTEHRPSSLEAASVKAYGKFYDGIPVITGWNDDFEDYSPKNFSKSRENGFHTAAPNIAAIFEYGSFRDGISSGTLQHVHEDIHHRSFDVSEPLIATGTQDEISTKHQLINAFPGVLRSALDQISHWEMRSTSCGKASGSIRRSSVRVVCKFRSFFLVFIICTNFVGRTTARTIPRNTSNEESIGSFTAAVIPLAHWPYLAFVIMTLLVAQYLAHMKDAIFVWGCMMTIWAFGWWTIRADSSTTLQISGVVLFLWAISAYQYGHVAFSKHRIPTRAGVIIIISAMILNVSTVTLMTPSEASTAQPELLLSLSLPFVSLILAAVVNTVAAMQSAEQTHQLEAGLQVHVPCIQEQATPRRQQRRLRTPVETYSRPVELPTTSSEGG